MLADPAVRADPVAFIEELRAMRRPIVTCRACYMTVDHKVASDLLRSDDFHVFGMGTEPAQSRCSGWPTAPNPISCIRFNPRRCCRWSRRSTRATASWCPRCSPRAPSRHCATASRTAANALLDEMTDAGTTDIVDRYCSQLPVTVIGDILGVPDDARSRILEFGELAAPSLDIGLTWRQYRTVNRGIQGFNDWLSNHLHALRRNPGEDLMSQIIVASEGAEGGPLTHQELLSTAGLVLAAGFETTVNLLGNGIRMLLDTPEHLDTLAVRPELWPTAVEEILRLDSPVQLSARIALKDTDVAGTTVRRGKAVILYLAGANRDPKVFDDPHRFDIERENAGKHLSFSGGRHYCLGAALARAEGEVGLRTFFERFPDARLAGGGSRRPTRVLRGWSTLPISLGKARTAVSS